MKKLIFVFIVLISIALTACDISSASLTTSSSTDSTTAIATTSTSTYALTTTSGVTPVTTSTTGAVITTSATTTSVVTTQRVFTLQELATYNGNSGSLAYMAVNGVVYNVTHASGWSDGWHQGLHLAGTDATVAFASSPHPNSYLDSLPVVGILGN